MTEVIRAGERVEVLVRAKGTGREDWFEATVVRIEPYSEHRSFYWVEFDEDVQAVLGFNRISIFNPKKMRKKEG
jgi:hypothetical protein